MGAYREWKYLKKMNQPNSIKSKQQIDRYQKLLDQWETASMEGKEVIVLIDSNIDTRHNSSHNSTFKVNSLHSMLTEHMNKHNITQHNFQLTHFPPQKSSSCLDHIFSNSPNKISNVTTHKNIHSDHSYITAIYNSIDTIYYPKFIKIRKNQLLTKHNLEQYIDHNQNFKDILNMTDPDQIACNLQLELNTIINSIAPAKIIQFSKDYQPYYSQEIRDDIVETQKLLDKAIMTYEFEDWVNYKNKRNTTQKNIKTAKKNYTIDQFSKTRDKWKTVKQINKTKSQQPPSKIKHENTLNITNSFYRSINL